MAGRTGQKNNSRKAQDDSDCIRGCPGSTTGATSTPAPPPIQTDTTPAGVPSPDTVLSTQVDTSTMGATLDYAPSPTTSSALSISGGTLSTTVLASSPLSPGGSTSHPSLSTQAQFYSGDAAGISTASSDSFPGGISNSKSTTSKHTGGAIAGGTISFVLLLIILGFVLYRYMIHRRRKRMAPSASYFAEFGTRPESWNRILSDHESRQYPSATHVSSAPETYTSTADHAAGTGSTHDDNPFTDEHQAEMQQAV